MVRFFLESSHMPCADPERLTYALTRLACVNPEDVSAMVMGPSIAYAPLKPVIDMAARFSSPIFGENVIEIVLTEAGNGVDCPMLVNVNLLP